MPRTLASLLRDPALGLRLLTPDLPTSAPVLWAHVSELADPTPWLEGGELMLTLGLGLSDEHADHDAYVRRLAERGVVALAVDTGIVLDEVPATLVAAGERYGLPIVRIPAPTPFIAISRAVLSALTDDAVESVRTVAGHQERVAAAALRSGPAGVVAVLAAILSARVAVVDGQSHIVVASSDDIEVLRARLGERLGVGRAERRVPALVHVYDDGVLTITPFVGESGLPHGLVVWSTESVGAHDRLVLSQAATLLSLLARTPGRIAQVEEHLRDAVVHSLLVEGGSCSDDLARALGFVPGQGIVVAHVLGASAEQARTVAGRVVRELDGPFLRATLGRAEAVIAPRGVGMETLELSRAPGAAVGLGMGDDLADAAAAHRRAGSAARVGLLQQRTVVSYADLAPVDLLLQSQPAEATAALVEGLLGQLVGHDRRQGTQLVLTLDAYLANNGNAEATATVLAVHRHTVRQRLDRIAALLGRDLGDATVRAELWLALRAHALVSSGSLPRLGGSER